MTWSEFIYFALTSIVLWLSAGVVIYRREAIANTLMILGMVTFSSFIILYWHSLGRAPMRTMGETRLWYSIFISLVGYLSYLRWRYKWLVSFSALMAALFVVINLIKPELHSQNLMPALQSPWFIPHVSCYMLSYAMLGAATIGAITSLIKRDYDILDFVDNMVYIGYGFLMLGLLMGALWAKDAWGHYWSWDPKETWAFVTTTAYLAYIHLRIRGVYQTISIYIVIIAFILLMVTWLGVGYLPSAQGSVHFY